MRCILDAGPIIALAKVGYLVLVRKLFDEIIVPSEVMREVARPGETRSGAEITAYDWIKLQNAPAEKRIEFQEQYDIANGEAEAILLALEQIDSSVLIIDDRRAMKCAHELNIKTLRTGALLVAAAKNDLITASEVQKAIEVLRKEHYFDSQAERDILALLNDGI